MFLFGILSKQYTCGSAMVLCSFENTSEFVFDSLPTTDHIGDNAYKTPQSEKKCTARNIIPQGDLSLRG